MESDLNVVPLRDDRHPKIRMNKHLLIAYSVKGTQQNCCVKLKMKNQEWYACCFVERSHLRIGTERISVLFNTTNV
jgi:hypothetical protein